MNTLMQVEAYKSYYSQGMEAFDEGDISKAKMLLLKAADMANKVSINSLSYDVRMEYNEVAKKILNFVKLKCRSDIQPITSEKKDNLTTNLNNEDNKLLFQPVNGDSKISFKDVAGLDEVKEQVEFKVLSPLKNPELAKKYKINAGAKILLYGPPGTGKTYIARAIAGEVDAAFYSINCQDLLSKYMGESSKLLDQLFKTVLKNERAIVFFDEFDSIASVRSNDTTGSDGEMARFVATFLSKIDGFEKNKHNKMLLLIAATNRPWAIDKAMIRGGRFDTHIYVGLPDDSAREFLVEKAFSGIPVGKDFDVKIVSSYLKGYGGGDIVAICEEICLSAYKKSIKNSREEEVSLNDCKQIISKHHTTVSKEELQKFIDFKSGKIE